MWLAQESGMQCHLLVDYSTCTFYKAAAAQLPHLLQALDSMSP